MPLRQSSFVYSIMKVLVVAVIATFGCQALAHVDSQLHFRSGLVGASFDGSRSGSFLVPTSLDLEYELFLSSKRSIAFRTIIAVELPESLPRYSYFGAGTRYYLGSQGMSFNQGDKQITVKSIPTTRYYIGVDGGFSIIILQSLGSVLQVMSSMVDLGTSFGVIRQITPDLGFHSQVGLSAGFGFNSSALVCVTYRGLVGLTYSF